MPYGSRVMNGCGYGLEYLVAGEAAFLVANYKLTEENAYQAMYRARQQKQADIEFSAYYLLLRVNICKGKFSKIKELLEELKQKEIHIENCISIYDMIEATFLLQIKQTDKVAKWIMAESRDEEKDVPVALGSDVYLRMCCYLAEERYYEILALAEQIIPLYEARGLLIGRISTYILQALAHFFLGNQNEAQQALQISYELSYPNKIIMLHMTFGGKMRTLLHAAKQDDTCTIPADWLELMYSKASTYAKRQAQIVADYNIDMGQALPIQLSRREQEVLSELAQGLTREEIAESCNLSLNTVKSMLQNIFNKLDATSSIDAVRIATQLNLIL